MNNKKRVADGMAVMMMMMMMMMEKVRGIGL